MSEMTNKTKDEIVVWLHDLIPNENGFMASVQIGGKFNNQNIDVGHFAYRNGKLKRLGTYKDCPTPLHKAMLKYARKIFKQYKGKKIPPHIPA